MFKDAEIRILKRRRAERARRLQETLLEQSDSQGVLFELKTQKRLRSIRAINTLGRENRIIYLEPKYWEAISR